MPARMHRFGFAATMLVMVVATGLGPVEVEAQPPDPTCFPIGDPSCQPVLCDPFDPSCASHCLTQWKAYERTEQQQVSVSAMAVSYATSPPVIDGDEHGSARFVLDCCPAFGFRLLVGTDTTADANALPTTNVGQVVPSELHVLLEPCEPCPPPILDLLVRLDSAELLVKLGQNGVYDEYHVWPPSVPGPYNVDHFEYTYHPPPQCPGGVSPGGGVPPCGLPGTPPCTNPCQFIPSWVTGADPTIDATMAAINALLCCIVPHVLDPDVAEVLACLPPPPCLPDLFSCLPCTVTPPGSVPGGLVTTVQTVVDDCVPCPVDPTDPTVLLSSLVGCLPPPPCQRVPLVGGALPSLPPAVPDPSHVVQPVDDALDEVRDHCRKPPSSTPGGTTFGGHDIIWGGIETDSLGNLIVAGSAVGTVGTTPGTVQPNDPNTPGLYDGFVLKLTPDAGTILWGTWIGGAGAQTFVYDVAVDSQDRIVVAGATDVASYMTTGGAYQGTHAGARDAFVTVLAPTGSAVLYSSFLGGADSDSAYSVAIGPNDEIVAAGVTYSTGFPVTGGAYQTTLAGGSDGFVARLAPFGGAAQYATYLGASSYDFLAAVAVDGSGRAHISGATQSPSYPVTGSAVQSSIDGIADAVYAVISASGGGLAYGTFLGGNGHESGAGLDLDASGRAHIAGYTTSTSFPLVAPVLASAPGSVDSFVAVIDSSVSGFAGLDFSTYWGGSGDDTIVDLDAHATGTFVSGRTTSTDLPTAIGLTPHDGTLSGPIDGFVTQIQPSTSSVEASTYVGGSASDTVSPVTAGGGRPAVAGWTASADFAATLGAPPPGTFGTGFAMRFL